MQRVGAALEGTTYGHRRVKLLKLRFQLLVDQQERSQRPMDVAVAGGHNLVDRSFARSRIHRIDLQMPLNKPERPVRVPVDCVDNSERLDRGERVTGTADDHEYKDTDDGDMKAHPMHPKIRAFC